MTAIAPWPEYPDLKRRFTRGDTLPGRFAGDTEAMGAVWDSLLARGVFEPADPALVDFQDRHTAVEGH